MAVFNTKHGLVRPRSQPDSDTSCCGADMAEPELAEGKHWGLGLIQSKQKSTAMFQQAVVTAGR